MAPVRQLKEWMHSVTHSDSPDDIVHYGLARKRNNGLHLARKYARIFVRVHYLSREANSFPRGKLEENCELRGTDNVQGQISDLITHPLIFT